MDGKPYDFFSMLEAETEAGELRGRTCFFTGHRVMPPKLAQAIRESLDCQIEKRMAEGVTEFISGAALGFDQMAARLVLRKKKDGALIRLILALPCRDQDISWSWDDKQAYRNLLAGADEVVYVSEKYTRDCMKKRNYYMADRSAFCICALLHDKSGTGQTVRYARSKGIAIVNCAGQELG